MFVLRNLLLYDVDYKDWRLRPCGKHLSHDKECACAYAMLATFLFSQAFRPLAEGDSNSSWSDQRYFETLSNIQRFAGGIKVQNPD